MERTLQFFPIENAKPSALTPEQIQHFNVRGFISSLNVFDEEEGRRNRDYFNYLIGRAMEAGFDSYGIAGWHTQCAGLYDLVTDARILDYVEDLLGKDLVCWGSNYFSKQPGDTKQVSWHQDAAYYPLTPTKTVTVWLAIDDVDEENGAMRFIPGSHLHGLIPSRASTEQELNLLKEAVDSPESYGDEPVSINLKAGQISMHSDLLLHGSEPNPSSRRRCGLTIRFAPPEVRALEPEWSNNAIIARGVDRNGNWSHHGRPAEERIPTGHWLHF